MQRRSSGSSEDSADVPVKTSRPQGQTRLNDAKSSVRHSHDIRQSDHHLQNSGTRSTSARSRRPSSNINWRPSHSRDGSTEKPPIASHLTPATLSPDYPIESERTSRLRRRNRQPQPWNPWAISILTLFTSVLGIGLLFGVLYSSTTLHCDPKGCRMSWMSPSYAKFSDFDTEHTRFATKYSLYLYREQGFDNGPKIKGIPVLFIPGNAGSYKQVRSIASESARYFHDVLQQDSAALNGGARSLDFFTVDFNEDFTAFHGQTMLDQAEYINEAIRYILSLYLDPKISERDPSLPDPSSVIILGHSMGGIVARTMFIMPNYQADSVNTIITMSAPHARPPVTFDPQIVSIYNDINNYWRRAYSKKSSAENALNQVTLVSIAGGGLDTVVPSDYVGLESIVPETHGFTAFTSTIPHVWTSMDHQAITWCDQFRKVIVRALYDVVDNRGRSQTKSRADRMRAFKRRFLTGLESFVEKTLLDSAPSTLLTLEDHTTTVLPADEHLVLRTLGSQRKPKAYLLPLPSGEFAKEKRFTLLSDSHLDRPDEDGKLEVLFCNLFPAHAGQSNIPFSANIDLSSDDGASTKFACKNTASDVVSLPASSRFTKETFFREDEWQIPPFSYLEYDMEDTLGYEFVAVVDKTASPTAGWLLAEFSDKAASQVTRHIGMRRLLSFGLSVHLPANRPMVTEVKLPSVQSSLLAYNLKIDGQTCNEREQIFTPLVRQYISEPYESKYFVNAEEVEISLHGVSPYVPPPMKSRLSDDGLSLQFWTDPTCDSGLSIRITIDSLGSLGKLYMRYRTIFASFPLLIVALVLRKQFQVYDNTGVFIPFSESLDFCLRRSLPMLLLSMTLLSLSMGQSGSPGSKSLSFWQNNTGIINFAQNDLLVGTSDPFFWFLIPMIGIICVGVCMGLHYVAQILTWLLSTIYSWVSARPVIQLQEKKRALSPAVAPSSPTRRLITAVFVFIFVSAFVPYQLAYVVACLVQLSTAVRANRSARETPSLASSNFNNYVHSIFLLMLWILPINLPTVVVWIRNLTVHWFTSFSSYYSILSILPFIVLVENLTAGKMIPPLTSRLRHMTNIIFFGTAVYAAIYGVTYGYMIHHLVNLIAAWLAAIHSASDSWTLSGISSIFEGELAEDRKQGKDP
ncbi:PGAP1-domain-containing protein [Annulohypoxylon maeteangense]|uniref:PGAP1-domain-containing protein n=1 Tax=Annulohypoxylon maeteangense TaxID=1927788 RepID=UPI002007CC55|nr:PGAP1-domain-containing protein [Annulohypoxylon maeteangense]KAI0888846.1 PGAP1-domain-containing protein [Annulohypoxylon maeteangense]